MNKGNSNDNTPQTVQGRPLLLASSNTWSTSIYNTRQVPADANDKEGDQTWLRNDRTADEPSFAATSASSLAAPIPSEDKQTIKNERTAEATLFIRNIPDNTDVADLRALFEPRGNAAGNKILDVHINRHRGFGFVDFDGPMAVTAILKEDRTSLVKDPRTLRKVESAFMINGCVLDVEKKKSPTDHTNTCNTVRRKPKKEGGHRNRGSRRREAS